MKTENCLLEARNSVTESIAQIRATLSAQVMDGTPYLLFSEIGGAPAVYGEWENRLGHWLPAEKGFRYAETVPNHLCGTVQMSAESAQKKCAQLNAAGRKAHYTTWRAFLEARLATELALLKTLSPVS